MRIIGNVLWLLLAGLWLAVAYAVAGVVNLVLVVTIPFAIQSFKLAGYALWPFGRVVVRNPDADVALSTLGNAIWFVTAGLWLALGHVVTGLLLMVTIIGFPLGVASMKMAGLALFPFGKQVVSGDEVGARILVQEGPRPIG